MVWQKRQGLLPIECATLAYWVGRGARLRDTHPALVGARRERLTQINAGGGQPMLAWSRAEPRRAGTNAVDAPILFVSNRDRAV
jgi:hypothetical protein